MESKPPTPFNRQAIFSVALAVLTLISFCVGVAPIPLSSLICYPSTVLLGLASVWTGAAALREMRQTSERGRRLAWISLWSVSLMLLTILCLTTLMILLFPYAVDTLRVWWHQIHLS